MCGLDEISNNLHVFNTMYNVPGIRLQGPIIQKGG